MVAGIKKTVSKQKTEIPQKATVFAWHYET